MAEQWDGADVKSLLDLFAGTMRAERKAWEKLLADHLDATARLHAKLIHEWSVHLFEADMKVVMAKRERAARELKRWARKNPHNRKHGPQLRRKVGGGFDPFGEIKS